jgi:outer membrane receptor protein involved in Fe transport
MNGKIMRRRLLASTIVAGAVLSAPAFAQTSTQTAPAGSVTGAANTATEPTTSSDGTAPQSNGGEIVVTGSRIPQPNLTSASPITAVSAQDLKLTGTTRVEDLLNSLPQVQPDQGGFSNNPSDGTATVNLRNLSSQRTLVLVNGRRVISGDPKTNGGADINTIPSIAIKRIDVLTGGAGSVYGSDAVAGVVNFVTDTDFTGVSIDGQYSLYTHQNHNKTVQGIVGDSGYPVEDGFGVDGRTREISAKIGAATDDGRGHVMAYFSYRKIAPVLQAARDYSGCSLNEDNTEPTGLYCGGSLTAAPATISAGGRPRFQIAPGSTISDTLSPYNFGPTNYFQRADKRYTAGFFAHYDVSDAVKPYAEFMFMDDISNNQVAPGGDFGDDQNADNLTINCDNPLLAANAGAFARICGAGSVRLASDPNRARVVIARRNVEGGGRVSNFRHTDYRAVLGSKGDIARGLSYDVSFQYSSVQLNESDTNYFANSRLRNALDVITDPTTGQPVCRSGGSCVPYNPFTGTTTVVPTVQEGVTQAALDYLQVPSFTTGENTEKVASGNFTFLGDEYGIKSPFADHGIGINFGAEYRRETLRVTADSLASAGDLSGFGSATPPVSGSFDVKEGFIEASIPLVSDKPFMNELTLQGGYRYSSYSLQGNVSSYKGEAIWKPIREVTIRGGYNRAVRAPNVSELFAVNQVALDGATDPCAGATPTFTAAQCANTGVTAAQYGNIEANPANQYNGLIGGPTDPSSLKPEKADTYTVGIVVTPGFLPTFNLSVDAYRIKVKGLISGFGADNILQTCGTTGDANFCSLIHRDTTPGFEGSLFQTLNGYVIDTTTNAGSITTQGLDVNANYVYRTSSLGSFGLSFNGTYLDKYEVDNFGPSKYRCEGQYGAICGNPLPHWRHRARLTWTSPWNFSLSGQWRFIGRTTADATESDPDLNSEDFFADDKIKNVSYFDLTMTARIADKFSFRVGAQNLLDKDPPIVGSVYGPAGSLGGGNTFPQTYDVLGRYVFAGISIDL